ncbi:helix-turn-helix domain-containing protein [Limnohabitans lacus]|uniref:Helix-turn-helix transcriptional regulator n=1 Tax=Limnohabitans lacus TaxID=3045173 RepID=A0ABT6X9D9_9BURK|nr:helix-turn-helix transcriptional regulator [Limnohabitans sp. HM2-2]MDI9234741.1 helix-turn-helix transcriptional regulator [Limnohabitans sp. HM2-2]
MHASVTHSLNNHHVFGRRLKAARRRQGLAQDKLGVLIGLDEHTASARISRYENGIHEPPVKTAQLIAVILNVPLAYLYCEDDRLADLILKASKLKDEQWAALGDTLRLMHVSS